ncbi:hypothetical protein [Streptomyces sp. NBC_00076]
MRSRVQQTAHGIRSGGRGFEPSGFRWLDGGGTSAGWKARISLRR